MRFSCAVLGASFFIAAALSLVAAPRAARAQVVTGYNALTLYQAAATTTATYDFENIAPTGNATINPSLTPLAVTVSGGQNAFVTDSAYFNGNYSLNGTATLQGAQNTLAAPGATTTTLVFGSAVTAFGTEFGFRANTKPSPTGTISVQLYNGATIVGAAFSSAVPATETFIGLTSTLAFDRAVFTSTAQTASGYQSFDTVRVGSSIVGASASEPGTLLLFGAGLASGLGAASASLFRKPCLKKGTGVPLSN